MRPQNLKTEIFLYSGLARETQEALAMLGFLDGQTTNAKLISKNEEIQKPLSLSKKFTREEIFSIYKKVVDEIFRLVPDGYVSADVYYDENTRAEDLIYQAKKASGWGKNIIVKLPLDNEGMKAAEKLVKEKIKISMNHCFSQEQAAAVYSATRGARPGQVFVSPRIERLDYGGVNGMDLVKNVLEMYKKGDGHVTVLSTDVGTIDHFLCSLFYGVAVISAPLRILKVWYDRGMPQPRENYAYEPEELRPLPYEEIDLNAPWEKYNIQHEMTQMSIQEAFSHWRELIT